LKTFFNHQVIHWNKAESVSLNRPIIVEEPLSIRVQGKPYSVIMRTPGDEIAHVAGFCLAEGIIETPDDYTSLAFCDGSDTNVVTITLNQSRQKKIAGPLDKRGFISQTSCGICGKEVVSDIYNAIAPLSDKTKIDIKMGPNCIDKLSSQQPLHHKTHASHAAALFGADESLLSAAEDVGRHNAVDKAIGKLFLKRKLSLAAILILSSRISYELVLKAARARIPIILAISRPTLLAVELASKLNITLACLARGTGLYVFCNAQRLKF